jgi:hypothetical protein
LGDAGTNLYDAGSPDAGGRYTQVVQNVLDPDYQVSTSPDTGGYSDPNTVVVANNVASSPNAQPVSVSGSPFTYSNNQGQLMAVDILGGAVSEIAKNGQPFSSVSPAVVWLQPGENVQVEYGQAAPDMHQLALPS